MVTYLSKFGIEAFVGPKKKYSTDANLAGLSHEAEDLEIWGDMGRCMGRYGEVWGGMGGVGRYGEI